jgi:hypothetical protein
MRVKRSSMATVSKECSGAYPEMAPAKIDWRLLAAQGSQFRRFLQQNFWSPLREAMRIFHTLPLIAAVLLFVLFATDGQFREIYISYLENPRGGAAMWLGNIVAAVCGITLLSAALYHAHNALSTARASAAFSVRSNPGGDSRLPRLQGAAAFALTFVPWAGLVMGLFSAQNFVAARNYQLLHVAEVDPGTLITMHPFFHIGALGIAAALFLFGIIPALFVAVEDRNRIVQWVVALASPILAVILFELFTQPEGSDQWLSWPLSTSGLIAAATGLYLATYLYLERSRNRFLLSRLLTHVGISFRKRRRRRLAMWAFVPWLAASVYFALSGVFGPQTWLTRSPGPWAVFPLAICCVIALGLTVSYILLRHASGKLHRITLAWIICGLAVAVLVISAAASPQFILPLYRFVGPLGTTCLELMFLIAMFAALEVLSQRSGFPAFTLMVLTAVVCVVFPQYAGFTVIALGVIYSCFAVVALVSGRPAVSLVMIFLVLVGGVNYRKFNNEPVVKPNPVADDTTDVKIAYLCWLDHRGIPKIRSAQQDRFCAARPQNLPVVGDGYPVFIVAVEGGGIYAASAAAMFLSQLQDRAPQLSEHIFAISGVSGGSIGAAIFHALDHPRNVAPAMPPLHGKTDMPMGKAEQCTRAAENHAGSNLAAKAANIMQDDHFSPIIGSIFPELFNAPSNRSDALTQSFEFSTFTQDEDAGQDLCAAYSRHWSPANSAPALILNSTWVEMGFRAAFAPFQLNNLNDSLYSFLDRSMPDEDCASKDGPPSCISLMTAAGVSARFPGIMPPFSVKMPDGKRWNFVDGAYSDNSGATTAMDVYNAISHDVSPNDVDLRVVLITSASPQPNLDDSSISGTAFQDTIAPINAILKVREDLGNNAVARACSEIYGSRGQQARGEGRQTEMNQDCKEHAGVKKDAALQIVEIQDQTYGLALGWKISQTSFAVVRWMLGDPKVCPELKESVTTSNVPDASSGSVKNAANAQLTKLIRMRNSCVERLMIELTTPSADRLKTNSAG